jgi:hypothetical protein
MRLIKFLSPFIATVLFCSCNRARTNPNSSVFTERAKLTEVTQNSVKVSVSLEADSVGKPVIRATFTPTEPGFHLYSKDMPEDGVKGFGRPTRLQVLGGVIKQAGPVFSDVSPHDLEVMDVKIPIYPEGPVTLRQPIEITTGRDDLAAQIEISYMACKTGGECKMPVERKRIELKLPNQ